MESDESSQGLSIPLRAEKGLVGFIFVLFLQEQTANIHGDIRMPGNPNKDDRCVLL